VLQDAVLVGEYGDHVGVLAFPNVVACRSLAGLGDDASVETVLADETVRDHVQEALGRHNAENTASSMRVERALLMAEPPQIDANEITDKGYINQRAVSERRAGLVAKVMADDPSSDVIVVP
jgi:feruloyl-CoA synthase